MKIDFLNLFRRLNKELEQRALSLDIICAGGFVLQQHGIRATKDVDAFFEASEEVRRAIHATGEDFGVNTEEEDWLNNSVQNLNRVPDKDSCDTLYELSNLTVRIAPLLYVAGMKLKSGRDQDIDDVASIIKKEGIQTHQEMLQSLHTYGFEDPDVSLLLDAFGRAYGMKWLESYFIENEELLLQMI